MLLQQKKLGIATIDNRFSRLEKEVVEVLNKNVEILKDVLNEIKKSHLNKSLMERIFGKD